jgi:hypothetical protein
VFALQIIYSKLTDLLPAEVVAEDDPSLERPSEDDVRDTTEKTRLALERLTHTKIAAAMPVRCAERAVSINIYFYHTVCSMKKFLHLVSKCRYQSDIHSLLMYPQESLMVLNQAL